MSGTFPIPAVAILMAPGWWRVPVAVVTIVPWLAVAARGFRLDFSADAAGVTVVNQFRTFQIAWDEVQEVIVLRRARFPAVAFVLRNGRTRIVQASGYTRHLRRQAWSIATTFAPSSVKVQPNPRF